MVKYKIILVCLSFIFIGCKTESEYRKIVTDKYEKYNIYPLPHNANSHDFILYDSTGTIMYLTVPNITNDTLFNLIKIK